MDRHRVAVKPTRRIRGKQTLKKPRKKYDRSKWKSAQPDVRKAREEPQRKARLARNMVSAAESLASSADLLATAFRDGVLHVKQELEAKHGLILELEGNNVVNIKSADASKELVILKPMPDWAK